MIPRDIVKLAFQFKDTEKIPFTFFVEKDYILLLNEYYHSTEWSKQIPPYLGEITGCDNFLSLTGLEKSDNGLEKDCFGCIWNRDTTDHLVEPPLKEQNIESFLFPNLKNYYYKHVIPRWSVELANTEESFRYAVHSFGLFERSWSLRGFENFLVDLIDNISFCEKLVEHIADWIIESIDLILQAPVDAIMLTDDYADQRGMIFGIERFKKIFKPHWKRIFDKIKKAGIYSILHVCGNAEPAIPDLIECGLDCLESLQPEAMDIYKVKKEYGKDLRFWGGLGVQQMLPFGSFEDVREEVRRLKNSLGFHGGYILNSSKPISSPIPIENTVAYLEEALL